MLTAPRQTEEEGRKPAQMWSLLTRLTPLIPMQIPRKGEAEKVVFKAFIYTVNCLKTKGSKDVSRKRKEGGQCR